MKTINLAIHCAFDIGQKKKKKKKKHEKLKYIFGESILAPIVNQ